MEKLVFASFDPVDCSDNIQKAIDSGAKEVVIPNIGRPWIIAKSLYCQTDDQKIHLLPGAILLATEDGSFDGSALLTIRGDNVVVIGYQAEIRMIRGYCNGEHSKDDQTSDLHCIAVQGARNFRIEGIRLLDARGSGIEISGQDLSKKIPDRTFSSGTVKDITCLSNRRHGISIVSAKDLLIFNSNFCSCPGGNLDSGANLEPHYSWEVLEEIEFSFCRFNGNNRHGIRIALNKHYGKDVSDIGIKFNSCKIDNNLRNGIDIQGVRDRYNNGAKGRIFFNNTILTNSGEHGIHYRNDRCLPNKTFDVIFKDSFLTRNGCRHPDFSPVFLGNVHSEGGVTNIDLGKMSIVDFQKRSPLKFSYYALKTGLVNIRGDVEVKNSQQLPVYWGDNLINCDLKTINTDFQAETGDLLPKSDG